MDRVTKRYSREIRIGLGVFANCPPNGPLDLGDVGILSRSKTFRKKTSLTELGIIFSVRKGTSPGNKDYISRRGVAATFKPEGESAIPGSALPKTKAGVTVDFTRNCAVMLQLWQYCIEDIDNIQSIEPAILDLVRSKIWKRKWVLVSRIYRSPSTTILMSKSSKGRTELVANAKVSTPEFGIADANLQLSIAFQKDMSIRDVATVEHKPFHEVQKIKGLNSKKPRLDLYDIGG